MKQEDKGGSCMGRVILGWSGTGIEINDRASAFRSVSVKALKDKGGELRICSAKSLILLQYAKQERQLSVRTSASNSEQQRLFKIQYGCARSQVGCRPRRNHKASHARAN